MAGEAIFACRGAAQGGALAGVTHARLTTQTSFKIDQGGNDAPGAADAAVLDKHLIVELYGNQYGVLLGRVAQTAAELTINTYGAAGASEALTVAKVFFSKPLGAIDFFAKDEGGKIGGFGIRGQVHFTAGQGFGDVLSAA